MSRIGGKVPYERPIKASLAYFFCLVFVGMHYFANLVLLIVVKVNEV